MTVSRRPELPHKPANRPPRYLFRTRHSTEQSDSNEWARTNKTKTPRWCLFEHRTRVRSIIQTCFSSCAHKVSRDASVHVVRARPANIVLGGNNELLCRCCNSQKDMTKNLRTWQNMLCAQCGQNTEIMNQSHEENVFRELYEFDAGIMKREWVNDSEVVRDRQRSDAGITERRVRPRAGCVR